MSQNNHSNRDINNNNKDNDDDDNAEHEQPIAFAISHERDTIKIVTELQRIQYKQQRSIRKVSLKTQMDLE